MIESLFDESPPVNEDEPNRSKSAEGQPEADSDDSWLDALREVKRIVRRKSFSSWQSEAADLVQGIALRLFKWRKKNKDKSREMSPEEWQKFAARTAYNEINRHHNNRNLLAEVPLDEAAHYAIGESLEGQSKAEESSLTLAAWQEICSMTLRHRRSLLFHSQKLYVYLLANGIDNEEIAACLEISLDCWMEVQERIPLSDAGIKELIRKEDRSKKSETTSGSIKKARVEARSRMRRVTDK